MATDHYTTPKTCTKCKFPYPDASIAFSKNKQCKDGYNYWCNSCMRKYRAENKETLKQKKHEQYLREISDPERKSLRLQQSRESKARNSENVKAYNKAYRARNRNRRTEYNRKWRLLNPTWSPEYKRQYDRENPDRVRAHNFARRARVRQNGGVVKPEDIQLLLRSQNGLCWWCGDHVGNDYHVDHRVPLARGGSNDARNLCISCPKCNQSKHNKLPYEWNGRLL